MLAPVAKCQDFVDRGKLLTNKVVTGLILCQQPKTVYRRHHDLVSVYNVAVSELISDFGPIVV